MSGSQKVLAVQMITSCRVASSIVFATTALTEQWHLVAIGAYVTALASDIADGLLARRLNVVTEIGGVYDGFADKTVTIVCTLFVSTAGVPLLPCILVLFRDILILSLRSVRGTLIQIAPPVRLKGALNGIAVRIGTAYVLLIGVDADAFVLSALIWAGAAASASMAVLDLWRYRLDIFNAFTLIKAA